MAYKQHFIEWFSGSSLSSIWTTTNLSGTNTFAMQDSVDGGFSILTQAVSNAEGNITFNGKHQYDLANSVCIFVTKFDDGNQVTQTGLSDDGTSPFYTPSNNYHIEGDTLNTANFDCSSNDGGGASSIDSTIAQDTSWHGWKIESDGTDLKFYHNGVLVVTKTTDLPTGAGAPAMKNKTRGGTATNQYIKYFEVYNT